MLAYRLSLVLLPFMFSSLVYGKPEKILLTGSSTLAPLMAELAQAYEKTHRGIQIDVQTGGSAKGILDCRDGLNDIGMVSRPLKTEESDLRSVSIAQDGIALIAHPSVPLQNLSREQVVKIYKGQVSNWKDLGGPDRKIIVMNKAEGRATLELFLSYFNLKSSEIKASVIIGDEEQGVKTIASSSGSIGYVSISTAENAAKSQAKIHSVNLDGESPSREAVLSGDYKLVRPLNLVFCGVSKAAAEKFVRFTTTKEAQSLVSTLGYIPLK